MKYLYSNHNWGIAFDFCRNDGKGAYNDNDGWFKKVGNIGKKFGLEWGGDWKDNTDKPHLELTKFGTTKQLVNKYKTFENFKKTWKDEVKCMFIKRDYKCGNKKKTFEVINEKGENYIRIRDLANLVDKTFSYDNVTKVTELK